ncbi:hypothetical protein FA048_17700 [Pedobacter polaris]|uniref:Uncharacterized protein n=1 Tax=Pedobacter polaris TaxID=2571273 RepID=A0A4U1CFZ0_9SPHI|nr:hypothetical protein [Pedobacter polaris]TKC05558.1 hypothetical protein FA048_17700 [Pedobacter polaris]
MSTENQNHKPSNDKLHPSDLGETKDFNDLSFDEVKQSYELDVKGDEKDYDHPMPYETVAAGSVDDNSTFDEANPYVGDEYATDVEKVNDKLEELGMHIDNRGESVLLSPEDELLARTEEDFRDDLDEEGYPKNDAPNAG